jgi:hypothetical protein
MEQGGPRVGISIVSRRRIAAKVQEKVGHVEKILGSGESDVSCFMGSGKPYAT